MNQKYGSKSSTRSVCRYTICKSCLTFRKTFFDVIDENIQYPPSLDSDRISAVSLADSKIIATSKSTNFSLFLHEKDSWFESIVELQEEIFSLDVLSEQLITVRNAEPER